MEIRDKITVRGVNTGRYYQELPKLVGKKPKNHGEWNYVSHQRKRKLRLRGESLWYDISTGFFLWWKR